MPFRFVGGSCRKGTNNPQVSGSNPTEVRETEKSIVMLPACPPVQSGQIMSRFVKYWRGRMLSPARQSPLHTSQQNARRRE